MLKGIIQGFIFVAMGMLWVVPQAVQANSKPQSGVRVGTQPASKAEVSALPVEEEYTAIYTIHAEAQYGESGEEQHQYNTDIVYYQELPEHEEDKLIRSEALLKAISQKSTSSIITCEKCDPSNWNQ